MAIHIQSSQALFRDLRFLLACVTLLFVSGCQSPWRMWRTDDPSLEQLLIRPEPWDAEAQLKAESLRSNNEGRGGSHGAESQGLNSAQRTRVSPKARGSKEPKATGIAEDSEDRDSKDAKALTDAEFEVAAAGTPPGLRHLLKQQWDATHNRNTANSSSFRLSDDSEEISHSTEDGNEEFIVQSKAKGKQIKSGDKSVVTTGVDDSSEDGLQELKPPVGRKSEQAIVHAKPRETHIPEQDLVTRPSSRKNSTNASEGSYVAPASAERLVTKDSAEPADAKTNQNEKSLSKEMGWRDLVREAIRRKAEERPTSPVNPIENLHDQATDRLLWLALGEIEETLKPIEGLQSNETDYFKYNFQSLHDAIDPAGNPVLSRRWTLASDSHRRALSHLSAVSSLEIKNATFCTEVTSFGVMNKFPNNQFRPGQQVLLYCELENFVAAAVKDGYETQLQGSYEIVDANGRRVADLLLPPDADFCKNQRRDYFIAYSIYMPEKLEKGRYQLRLTIEDMKARKFGQSTLDFQVN